MDKEEIADKVLGSKTKYTLSSFDIVPPRWTGKAVDALALFTSDSPLFGCWCKVIKKETDQLEYIEKILRKLRILFQTETGDFHDTECEQWEECYILVHALMRKPKAVYAVGFVQVREDKEINLAWTHPFLRGYGYFKRLYIQLLAEGKMYLPTPPVSRPMLIAINNAIKFARGSNNPVFAEAVRKWNEYALKHPDRTNLTPQQFKKQQDNVCWEALEHEAKKL